MNHEEAVTVCNKIVDNIASIYVGYKMPIKKVLAAALVNGHVLFEDNPGLGKTLLAKTFARTIGCKYSRIQFTPDMLPADIIGISVWRQQNQKFEFIPGPIFTNILLTDEINRATPKTQSALLEAMGERQVTVEGRTFALNEPFFVLATQNPIEYEGTYPLPEAQMDRFMFRISTGYTNTLEDEKMIVKRRVEWKKDDPTSTMRSVATVEEFLAVQNLIENEVYVDDVILEYISAIVRKTREHDKVYVGSSPRGSISLLKASRAIALMQGRDFVTPDDVKLIVEETLAHRIILKTDYVLEGLNEKQVVAEVLDSVPVPKDFRERRKNVQP